MNRRLLHATFVFLLGSLSVTARADDWPQWLGPHRDGVWRETGIVDVFPAGGPKIRWRVPVNGGYSSPTVAAGRVFIHDRIRNASAPATRKSGKRLSAPGVERVLCLDESTGKTLWVQEYPSDYTMAYPAGPRAAPIVDGKLVYTYGAEADLQCRQVEDGKLLWQKNLSAGHTPIWGFSSSPLIDGDKIIVTGGDAAGSLVALKKGTGELLWTALPAREPGYSSPVLITAGGARQLIIWNPESLNSVDPETGKVYWSEPFFCQSGLSVATPRFAGDLLYVTSFYSGSMLMRLDPAKPEATKVWKIAGKSERNTDSLQGLICTPIIKDDYIYGVCSYGQFRCIKLLTGERVWETFAATTGEKGPVRWANAFIIPHENRDFLFNENGDLIIAMLTPQGYQELSRAHLIEPANHHPNRPVVWCQPAFANKCIFVRNDVEVVCASLAIEAK
jgi:outer membrane protein assembly factor BamB